MGLFTKSLIKNIILSGLQQETILFKITFFRSSRVFSTFDSSDMVDKWSKVHLFANFYYTLNPN